MQQAYKAPSLSGLTWNEKLEWKNVISLFQGSWDTGKKKINIRSAGWKTFCPLTIVNLRGITFYFQGRRGTSENME